MRNTSRIKVMSVLLSILMVISLVPSFTLSTIAEQTINMGGVDGIPRTYNYSGGAPASALWSLSKAGYPIVNGANGKSGKSGYRIQVVYAEALKKDDEIITDENGNPLYNWDKPTYKSATIDIKASTVNISNKGKSEIVTPYSFGDSSIFSYIRGDSNNQAVSWNGLPYGTAQDSMNAQMQTGKYSYKWIQNETYESIRQLNSEYKCFVFDGGQYGANSYSSNVNKIRDFVNDDKYKNMSSVDFTSAKQLINSETMMYTAQNNGILPLVQDGENAEELKAWLLNPLVLDMISKATYNGKATWNWKDFYQGVLRYANSSLEGDTEYVSRCDVRSKTGQFRIYIENTTTQLIDGNLSNVSGTDIVALGDTFNGSYNAFRMWGSPDIFNSLYGTLYLEKPDTLLAIKNDSYGKGVLTNLGTTGSNMKNLVKNTYTSVNSLASLRMTYDNQILNSGSIGVVVSPSLNSYVNEEEDLAVPVYSLMTTQFSLDNKSHYATIGNIVYGSGSAIGSDEYAYDGTYPFATYSDTNKYGYAYCKESEEDSLTSPTSYDATNNKLYVKYVIKRNILAVGSDGMYIPGATGTFELSKVYKVPSNVCTESELKNKIIPVLTGYYNRDKNVLSYEYTETTVDSYLIGIGAKEAFTESSDGLYENTCCEIIPEGDFTYFPVYKQVGNSYNIYLKLNKDTGRLEPDKAGIYIQSYKSSDSLLSYNKLVKSGYIWDGSTVVSSSGVHSASNRATYTPIPAIVSGSMEASASGEFYTLKTVIGTYEEDLDNLSDTLTKTVSQYDGQDIVSDVYKSISKKSNLFDTQLIDGVQPGGITLNQVKDYVKTVEATKSDKDLPAGVVGKWLIVDSSNTMYGKVKADSSKYSSVLLGACLPVFAKIRPYTNASSVSVSVPEQGGYARIPTYINFYVAADIPTPKFSVNSVIVDINKMDELDSKGVTSKKSIKSYSDITAFGESLMIANTESNTSVYDKLALSNKGSDSTGLYNNTAETISSISELCGDAVSVNGAVVYKKENNESKTVDVEIRMNNSFYKAIKDSEALKDKDYQTVYVKINNNNVEVNSTALSEWIDTVVAKNAVKSVREFMSNDNSAVKSEDSGSVSGIGATEISATAGKTTDAGRIGNAILNSSKKYREASNIVHEYLNGLEYSGQPKSEEDWDVFNDSANKTWKASSLGIESTGTLEKDISNSIEFGVRMNVGEYGTGKYRQIIFDCVVGTTNVSTKKAIDNYDNALVMSTFCDSILDGYTGFNYQCLASSMGKIPQNETYYNGLMVYAKAGALNAMKKLGNKYFTSGVPVRVAVIAEYTNSMGETERKVLSNNLLTDDKYSAAEVVGSEQTSGTINTAGSTDGLTVKIKNATGGIYELIDKVAKVKVDGTIIGDVLSSKLLRGINDYSAESTANIFSTSVKEDKKSENNANTSKVSNVNGLVVNDITEAYNNSMGEIGVSKENETNNYKTKWKGDRLVAVTLMADKIPVNVSRFTMYIGSGTTLKYIDTDKDTGISASILRSVNIYDNYLKDRAGIRVNADGNEVSADDSSDGTNNYILQALAYIPNELAGVYKTDESIIKQINNKLNAYLSNQSIKGNLSNAEMSAVLASERHVVNVEVKYNSKVYNISVYIGYGERYKNGKTEPYGLLTNAFVYPDNINQSEIEVCSIYFCANNDAASSKTEVGVLPIVRIKSGKNVIYEQIGDVDVTGENKGIYKLPSSALTITKAYTGIKYVVSREYLYNNYVADPITLIKNNLTIDTSKLILNKGSTKDNMKLYISAEDSTGKCLWGIDGEKWTIQASSYEDVSKALNINNSYYCAAQRSITASKGALIADGVKQVIVMYTEFEYAQDNSTVALHLSEQTIGDVYDSESAGGQFMVGQEGLEDYTATNILLKAKWFEGTGDEKRIRTEYYHPGLDMPSINKVAYEVKPESSDGRVISSWFGSISKDNVSATDNYDKDGEKLGMVVPKIAIEQFRGYALPTVAGYTYSSVSGALTNGFGMSAGSIPDSGTMKKTESYTINSAKLTFPIYASSNKDSRTVNPTFNWVDTDDSVEVDSKGNERIKSTVKSGTFTTKMVSDVTKYGIIQQVDILNVPKKGEVSGIPEVINAADASGSAGTEQANEIKKNQSAIGTTYVFYPYVQMYYKDIDSSNLNNTSYSKAVNVLASQKSVINTIDYCESTYSDGTGVSASTGGNVIIDSEMWSTHKRALDSKGTEKVLPGGATYGLKNSASTDNAEDNKMPSVTFKSYQWICDGIDKGLVTGSTELKYKTDATNEHYGAVSSIESGIKNSFAVAQGVRERASDSWKEVKPGAKYSWNGNTALSNEDKYTFGLGGVYGQGGKFIGVKTNRVVDVADTYTVSADVYGNIYLKKNGVTSHMYGKYTKYSGAGGIYATMGTEWQDVDNKTGLVYAYVNSLMRNLGNDNTYLGGTDYTWYNESFLPMSVVVHTTKIQISIDLDSTRAKYDRYIMNVLDPIVTPSNTSKDDLFTKFVESQFMSIKTGNIGYKFHSKTDYTVSIPDGAKCLFSKTFYIPNATVMDID